MDFHLPCLINDGIAMIQTISQARLCTSFHIQVRYQIHRRPPSLPQSHYTKYYPLSLAHDIEKSYK